MSATTKKKKLVIATDVRFWHKKTGAQRRIFSMVDYLRKQDFEIVTLLASALTDEANQLTATDELVSIRREKLVVRSLIDDWQPRGFIARIVWQYKCIANWLSSLRRQRHNDHRPVPARTFRYLNDFESPLFRERFQQMVDRIQPDAVLVQYVTLSYLVPDSRSPDGPDYLVDTHDLLSDRFEQFRRFGYDHWIRICPEEESEALRKFDTVIAIQDHEQRAFREMTGRDNVIVAGHPSDASQPSTIEETLGARYSLGYFASDNPSNVYAIQWFLDNVWPGILVQRPAATLLIAGTVCRALNRTTLPNGITCLPNVEDVCGLYRSFMIAINPVQFGTGLKIKNQEALAYGKPLVVTTQGFTGTPPADGLSPFHVVDNAQQMTDKITELLDDAPAIRQLAEAARKYAHDKLSPDFVYQSLVTRLRQTTLQQNGKPD